MKFTRKKGLLEKKVKKGGFIHLESFKKKGTFNHRLLGCTATDRHNNTLPHTLLLWCNINTMEFMMFELVREDLGEDCSRDC
jgi:hypothetical protein